MIPLSDKRPASTGPGLAIGLALALLVVALLIIKLWYMKHRRIQTIHAPPTSTLPVYHTYADASFANFTSNFNTPVCSDFGHTCEKGTDAPAAAATPSMRDRELANESFYCAAGSPNQETRALTAPSLPRQPFVCGARPAGDGILLGMLGSPDWEIGITRTVDSTVRGGVIAASDDALAQRVQEMPVPALSRMSSHRTMRAERTSRDSHRSPYLSGLRSATTSVVSLLTQELRGTSLPTEYNSYHMRPFPSKAQALLDIPEASFSDVQTLEDIGVAVPAKAQLRLATMVSPSHPAPESPWSTSTHFRDEMQFAAARTARSHRADALGFAFPTGPITSTPPRKAAARRKPVPSAGYRPPTVPAPAPRPRAPPRAVTFSEPRHPPAALREPLAHQRMSSLDSLWRVRATGLRTRPVHSRTNSAAVVPPSSIALNHPHRAMRRSRSVDMLRDVAVAERMPPRRPQRPGVLTRLHAASASTASLPIAQSTPRKPAVPPTIQVFSPSPVKVHPPATGAAKHPRGAAPAELLQQDAPCSPHVDPPSTAAKLRQGKVPTDIDLPQRADAEQRRSSIAFPIVPDGMPVQALAESSADLAPDRADTAPAPGSLRRTSAHRRSYLAESASDATLFSWPSLDDEQDFSRRSGDVGSSGKRKTCGRASNAAASPLIEADRGCEAAWLAARIDGSFDEEWRRSRGLLSMQGEALAE